MIDNTKRDAETRMKKAVEALVNELSKLRTGRAHPVLLEHVKVSYYGNETPLNQVANISIADSRTLLVTPWEKTLVTAIEKAIVAANLGLNPATLGTSIRVPLPPLTEERRKEMIRVVRAEGENAKVAIRTIRRDANNHLKEALKTKQINEDEERRAEEMIQKLTDKYSSEVDQALAHKEKDLMEI